MRERKHGQQDKEKAREEAEKSSAEKVRLVDSNRWREIDSIKGEQPKWQRIKVTNTPPVTLQLLSLMGGLGD